jgi:hypothetical protein
MRTGINPGRTGIVLILRGIDATPGQDSPARSRVDRARSREPPIPTGIDATLHRHRCLSESGRPDQMRRRPDSDRDRCPKSSGRCLSDRGTTLSGRSRCLGVPGRSRRMRDRSLSKALGCQANLVRSLAQRGRIRSVTGSSEEKREVAVLSAGFIAHALYPHSKPIPII